MLLVVVFVRVKPFFIPLRLSYRLYSYIYIGKFIITYVALLPYRYGILEIYSIFRIAFLIYSYY